MNQDTDTNNIILWGLKETTGGYLGRFGHNQRSNTPAFDTNDEEPIVDRYYYPNITLVTTTSNTTIYKDTGSGVEEYLTDLPLDFSSTNGFSEQIVTSTELNTLGLNGKTVIGLKYTFKNSLSDGSNYSLENQKLSIKYTNSTNYLNTYNQTTPSTGISNLPNLVTNHIFSLTLDNINGGAAPIDTTPQDFYIYFENNSFVLDTSKNIVIIWENASTSNSNNTAGGMTILAQNISSTDNSSYKVYTYYPDISVSGLRKNEIPIISFITSD